MSAIEVDPSAPGTYARYAFLVEGVLNLGGITFITHPRLTLEGLLARPSEINPTTLFLNRVWGAWTCGALVLPLLAIYPNTRKAIDARPMVYQMFGLMELTFLGVLAIDQLSATPALARDAAAVFAAFVIPLVSWRGYCLYVKPEMLGRYKLKKD